jgi:uncharacterized protein YggE
MKKMIITMLALFISGVAIAQTGIRVSGRAEKSITPDEIYVSITIKDGDVKNQTVTQIESTMKSRLKKLDIDVEKNLKATDMSNTLKKRNQVNTHRSYELKVGDMGTFVAVFDILNELNVSDADIKRVSHSRMEEFRKEVRVAAIRNAKTNAEQIAEAIGQSVGPAKYIDDNGNMHESSGLPITRLIRIRGTAANASDEDLAEPTIEFNDITLSYQLTARFDLN